MKLDRREFILAGGALAAGCVSERMPVPSPEAGESSADGEAAKGALIISPPVLQNAAETSMGVGFAVSDMANGYVDVSESSDLAGARRVKCGGYRVTDMNDKIVLVRLTGLKPATTYCYRIGADRIEYKGGYSMKIVGHEEDARVYSFRTLGAGARQACPGGGRESLSNRRRGVCRRRSSACSCPQRPQELRCRRVFLRAALHRFLKTGMKSQSASVVFNRHCLFRGEPVLQAERGVAVF